MEQPTARYFTFLGTGTSSGVPVIGCRCAVCTSTDRRDARLRTAAMVSFAGQNVVIDAGPDFRQQMLRAKVDDVAAILFTHEHNDHVAGLDDVRPLNFQHKRPMPIYATPSVQADLQARFAYAFSENPYPGAPSLAFFTIFKNKKFEISNMEIEPIEVLHGRGMTVLGFRFGDLTYITDCKSIENEELKKITGSRFLILNALHHKEHHAHLTLEQAVALAKSLDAERTFFTHISHNMGKYAYINPTLPKNMQLAFDGLRFAF